MNKINNYDDICDTFGTLSEIALVYAKSNRRHVSYFDQSLSKIKFNPLKGSEECAIYTLVNAFKFLSKDYPQDIVDLSEMVIKNSVRVLKRLMLDNADLNTFVKLINNTDGIGRKLVMKFSKIKAENETIAKENTDIQSWFLNEYFNEQHTKTYEHVLGMRSLFSKLLIGSTMSKYIYSSEEDNSDCLDFRKAIKNKEVYIFDFSKNLRSDYVFFKELIVFQYIYNVFHLKESKIQNILYIDTMWFLILG